MATQTATARQQSAGNVQKLVGTAVLAALIVILQTTVGSIQVGAFTMTFSLVPIVIGAALYGVGAGTILGTVFGVVVAGQVLAGAAGAFSATMFAQAPAATIIVCVMKGLVAGLAAGLAAKAIMPKHLTLGVIIAAILTPVCNTGIFSIAMLTIFRSLLESTAGSQNVITFLLVAFIGVNFIVELLINVILAPVVVNIIKAVRKNG